MSDNLTEVSCKYSKKAFKRDKIMEKYLYYRILRILNTSLCTNLGISA